MIYEIINQLHFLFFKFNMQLQFSLELALSDRTLVKSV